MPTTEQQNIENIRSVLDSAITIMSALGPDFTPNREVPEALNRHFNFDKLLADPAVVSALQGQIAELPAGLFETYNKLSRTLSLVLRMFGWEQHDISPFDVPQFVPRDPELINLLTLWRRLGAADEGGAGGDDLRLSMQVSLPAPPGKPEQSDWPGVVWAEIERRVLLQAMPFSSSICALLGPGSLRWFNRVSNSGWPCIQIHEHSRTGIVGLDHIGNQIEIEQEIFRLSRLNEDSAKCAIAVIWGLAALASVVPTSIFISESDYHLSSIRDHQFTVSYGMGSRSIVELDSTSMVSMLRIIRDGLLAEDLSACDLMWIANALAKRRSIRNGPLQEPATPRTSTYELFLSHRGTDAKRTLAEVLLSQGKQTAIFLDCLTMPRSMINRNFVFGSLANSKTVAIVETAHYRQSPWCRKELWLSERMADQGMVKLVRTDVPAAIKLLRDAEHSSSGADIITDYAYPMSARVSKDATDEMRSPNRTDVETDSPGAKALAPTEQFLASSANGDLASFGSRAAHEILELFKRVDAADPGHEKFELWATAAQYAVAMIGEGSNARSMVEVRRGIDQLNQCVRALIDKGVMNRPEFRNCAAHRLATVACSVVLDMSGHHLHPLMEAAMSRATATAAVYRSGLLLLDVRQKGALRDLNLDILAILVANNIGGVGIIQRADDPVHEMIVDGRTLSVLPCVTLHAGMEHLYPELPPLTGEKSRKGIFSRWFG